MDFKELWEKANIDCYGSGEEAILISFKTLFETFENQKEVTYSYDYAKGLKALGNESLLWSLIILLDHANFIDWGTSIRFGWTTNKGTEFVRYVLDNSAEYLYELIMKGE